VRRAPGAPARWWTRHFQDHYEGLAANAELPKWHRVTSLAYARHRANGHAQFGVGELADTLGTIDLTTGEVVPDSNIARAIKVAVGYGMLAEGSSAKCLMVPRHAVMGGPGKEHDKCLWHDRRRHSSSRSLSEL
jgi:hypothetical protein